MNILNYQRFFLVGIKGVAMTSLAQCLVDAGKHVEGADVSESFVSQPHIDRLSLTVLPLTADIPVDTDCVVYTAAHQGPDNPLVLTAIKLGIPTFSQAEAIASLFNLKQGIAVCGVGGKSTVSAMIAWILESMAIAEPDKYMHQSFSVGVGDIPTLNKTGQWQPDSALFVAEADDYVIDPAAASKGLPITPRFTFLQPQITVCTNLQFDHPDVYRDFDHTKAVFLDFFRQIKPNGTLVINGDDQNLVNLAHQLIQERPDVSLLTYGKSEASQVRLIDSSVQKQVNLAQISADQEYQLSIKLPGIFNVMNALAALTAAKAAGVEYADSLKHLATFPSTKRRFEHLGQKNGVEYYDDYAHHPHEVAAAIKAFQAWHPNQRVAVCFQSHTFSRTRELFDEFVEALATNPEIIMIDIFPSAREKFDPTMTSDILCQAIEAKHPSTSAKNLHTLESMAAWCQTELRPGDVCITLGAGDIYHVHDLI